MAFAFGNSNPIGEALSSGAQAFALGTAIRKQPEQEAQAKEDRAAELKQRGQTDQLNTLKLAEANRQALSQQHAQDIVGKINAIKSGGDVSDEDLLKSMTGAGVPTTIGSPQFEKDASTLVGATQGAEHYNSPAVKDAFNRTFEPSINWGVGQQSPDGKTIVGKKVAQLGPSPNGGLFAAIYNHTDDGKGYDALATQGRDSTSGAPPKEIQLPDAIQHLSALDQLHEDAKSDPKVSAALDRIRAMSPDQKRQTLLDHYKADYATATNQVYDPQAEADANRTKKQAFDLADVKIDEGKAGIKEKAAASAKDYAEANKANRDPVQKYQFFNGPDGVYRGSITGDGSIQKMDGGPTSITKPGGAAAPQSALTPEAVDTAAATYRTTGALPIGFSRDKATVAAIANRAAALASADGKTGEAEALLRASNKASQGALADITKRSTALEANAATAENNFKTIEGLSAEVDRTGSPIINKLKNVWNTSVVQDPKLAALKNAVSEGATEYAKVVTGQTTGAAVSDSANQQMQKLLSVSDSPAAFRAELATMRAMIVNRKQGYATERQHLMDSLHPGSAAADPATAPMKSTSKSGKPIISTDGGKTWQFNDG